MADKYLYGNGDFALVIGASTDQLDTAFDAVAASFGQLKKLKISPKIETKPHYTSKNGLKVKDANRTSMAELTYTATVENIDEKVVRALFYAGAGTEVPAAGGEPAWQEFDPLSATGGLEGIARVRLWDTQDNSHPKLVHRNFHCTVKLAGEPELGNDDYASVDLIIEVLGDKPGKARLRKDT